MSHEIQQWIAEIKGLQQQLADLERDREAALESAANWRQLYNVEAQQRRDEAKLSQQTIETLQSEIQQLQAKFVGRLEAQTDVSVIPPAIEQLQSVEELQLKLAQAMLECDRLAQALQSEKEAHAQTRQILTTALGDAVDAIARKEQGITPTAAKAVEVMPPEPAKLPEAEQPEPTLPASARPIADLPALVKSPSLQLPPTRPAPPRF